MGEACPVMIPFRGEKDLGLVLQPPEGLAVKDPVPVPLVDGAEEVLGLLSVPARGPAAERRERRQDLFFCRLQLFYCLTFINPQPPSPDVSTEKGDHCGVLCTVLVPLAI